MIFHINTNELFVLDFFTYINTYSFGNFVVVFQFVNFFCALNLIFYFQLLLMLQMTKSSMVLTYKTILCIMYNEPRDLFLSVFLFVYKQHIFIYNFCCFASFFYFKVVVVPCILFVFVVEICIAFKCNASLCKY